MRAPEQRPDIDRRHAPAAAGRTLPSRVGALLLKTPVHIYRYTLSLLIGRTCRHLPTCSEYALEAIDLNGPWRGLWLTAARCARCHPWGSSGFDPVPDIRGEKQRWAPWRYGRWRGPRLH